MSNFIGNIGQNYNHVPQNNAGGVTQGKSIGEKIVSVFKSGWETIKNTVSSILDAIASLRAISSPATWTTVRWIFSSRRTSATTTTTSTMALGTISSTTRNGSRRTTPGSTEPGRRLRLRRLGSPLRRATARQWSESRRRSQPRQQLRSRTIIRSSRTTSITVPGITSSTSSRPTTAGTRSAGKIPSTTGNRSTKPIGGDDFGLWGWNHLFDEPRPDNDRNRVNDRVVTPPSFTSIQKGDCRNNC